MNQIKHGLILFSCLFWIKFLLPPENITQKIKTDLNVFSTYVLLCQSKTLNKIYKKILYSVGFIKPAFKLCAPNS